MANDKKEPVAPSAAPQIQLSRDWANDADHYLTSKGWKKTGVNEMGFALWEDPASKAVNETVKIELPAAGGGVETIKQLVVQPSSWIYGTADAISIQRQRDVVKK